MEAFSRFNFRVARALGIIDFDYDRKSGTLVPWHKESIIYGLILKVFYFISCIYLFIYFKDEEPICFSKNPVIRDMNLATDSLIIIHVIIILIESLANRQLVYRIIAAFLKYMKEYQQSTTIKDPNEKKNYILTSMLVFAIFSKLPLGMLFASGRVQTCEIYSFSYAAHTTCLVMLWYLSIVIDAYVLSAFLVAYMLLDQLSDKLQKHAREIKLMQLTKDCSQPHWLSIWQQSLTASIQKITYQQRTIKNLLQEVVHTFWGSILCTLFNRALQLVFALSALVIRLASSETVKDKIVLIIFVLTLAQSLVLLFYFGQCVTNEFRKMQSFCYEARFQLDFPSSTEAKALDQSLEALTLELQHEHFRIRLFGVFNIDIAAAFSTLAACFMHFLFILQTLIQFFLNRERDKKNSGLKSGIET